MSSSALLQRYHAIRWLWPDAAMDAFTKEAQSFLEERFDELRSAMGRIAGTESSGPERLQVTRSILEAKTRSGHVEEVRDLPVFSAAAEQWAELLEQAHAIAERRAREALGETKTAELANDVWNLLGGKPRAWRDDMHPSGPAQPLVPGGVALISHAWWIAKNDGVSSPWEPLLALWERGSSTCATTTGELLIYVPVRQKGALLTEPDGAPCSKQHLFSGEVHSPAVGWSMYPKAPTARGFKTLRQFNRAGLGPLPEMVSYREAFFGIMNAPDRFDRYYATYPEKPMEAKELDGSGAHGGKLKDSE